MTNNEITYEVRGAIYDVYKELGPGLLESVYEEALCFELEQRGLKPAQKAQIPLTEIYYEYLFQMMSWFSLEVS